MEKRGTQQLSAVVAAVLFVVMVAVNGLANALPLNGINTGQLSDEIPNLFVPAGITFAIWGLIYVLLFCYVLAGLIAAFGKKGSSLWKAPDAWLFSINAVYNAVWIFAWHWRMIGLSLFIMLGILATLLVLLARGYKANKNKKALQVHHSFGQNLLDFFLYQPILVYLGWICVAFIANVTAFLVSEGVEGFGTPALWVTVAVIIVGTVIALSLVLKRGAVASGLVFIWAYAGIFLKRRAVDPEQTMPIIIAVLVGSLIIFVAIIYKLFASRRKV